MGRGTDRERWRAGYMTLINLQQFCCNSYPYPYSSLVIGLRTLRPDDITKKAPKTQNRSSQQFRANNFYSIKRRQKRNSTDYRISSSPSRRLWLLLDNHFTNANISCPKCGVTLNRLRSLTTFRGDQQ